MGACNLCGGKEFVTLFPGKDRMHGVPGSFSIVRCDSCGLYSCRPALTQRQLGKYYKDSYYSFKTIDSAAFRPRLERKVFETYGQRGRWLSKLALLPVKPLFRSARVIKGGRVLDVGCGSGDFLLQMKLLGMEPYGVEPGNFDERYARRNGLRITKGSLYSARFKSGFFDVVTINHVFEHVDDPTRMLKEVRRVLKPGGLLIIGVPQTRSLAAALFGRYWVQLDVPRHRFLFSTRNLKQYARKTGYEVKRVRYNSLPFQFLGSMFYATNRFRKRERLLEDHVQSKALFIILLPLAYLCNLFHIGDQVEIVLRKGAR